MSDQSKEAGMNDKPVRPFVLECMTCGERVDIAKELRGREQGKAVTCKCGSKSFRTGPFYETKGEH